MTRLNDIVRWVLAQGWSDPLQHPTYLERRTGNRYCVDVLYRDTPWQVERVYVPTGEITLHRHPDMDSCECFIHGSGVLQINHRRVQLQPGRPNWQQIVPIPSFAWHGGRVGEQGVCFLSIQHWKHGISPTSALENWEGPHEIVAI